MIQCPLHTLTGLSCPFCGTQRALLAALQGDFLGALAYNWFLPLLIPWAAALLLCKTQYRRRINIAFLALLVVWGVVRNLLNI